MQKEARVIIEIYDSDEEVPPQPTQKQIALSLNTDRAIFYVTPTSRDDEFAQFLSDYRPSLIRPEQFSWIQVIRKSAENFQKNHGDIFGAQVAWNSSPLPRSKQLVEQIAREHKVLDGKWMLFPNRSDSDTTWQVIASAVRDGALGSSAKVTKPPFCI